MEKHHKLIISSLIILALAAVSIFWLSKEKPIAVIVATIDYGSVQSTASNTRAGTIKACRRSGISPAIGGQIARLPVKEGDQVKTGQVLMELWNDDQTAQLELARNEARAAEANSRQTCIRAEVAQREAQRLQQLRNKKLISEELLDKADGESRALQAACYAAKSIISVQEAKMLVVATNLARTRLTAPFDGIVAQINGEVGEFVTPSPVGIATPPAVDIVDISCLYVSAPIDEVDAPKIRVGMPANISLDSMGDQTFSGQVRRIAPFVFEVEKQARTVDVEVDFLCSADCEQMLPGYSADIEIILEERDQALRVPTEAVMEGNKVLLLNADGMLVEQEITSGLSNWAWTEVTDGLAAKDQVVTSVDRDGVADGVAAVAEETEAEGD